MILFIWCSLENRTFPSKNLDSLLMHQMLDCPFVEAIRIEINLINKLVYLTASGMFMSCILIG